MTIERAIRRRGLNHQRAGIRKAMGLPPKLRFPNGNEIALPKKAVRQ